MAVSPHDVCDQLLQQLRLSNLNFVVSETPYSAKICLRKRFVKEANGPDVPNLPSKAKLCDPHLENQIQHLESKNSILKTHIIDLEAVKETFKETANLLEEKLSKAEASALKSFNAQRD
jgi:hypothetical protein